MGMCDLLLSLLNQPPPRKKTSAIKNTDPYVVVISSTRPPEQSVGSGLVPSPSSWPGTQRLADPRLGLREGNHEARAGYTDDFPQTLGELLGEPSYEKMPP